MDLGSVSGRSLYFFWSIILSRRRVFIYIDGNNTLESLKDIGIDGHHFDYRKYFSDLMAPYQEIRMIKYFGAVFPESISIEKFKADHRFHSFLEGESQKIKVNRGKFKINGGIPVEKGVDVKLATELIFDAFYKNYDDAYVCSADSDLIPAIDEVRKNFKDKKIFALVPAGKGIVRGSFDGVITIYPNSAKKCIVHRAPDPGSLKDLEAKFTKK